MNWGAVRAIFNHEMARFFRTITQSLASPVISVHGTRDISTTMVPT